MSEYRMVNGFFQLVHEPEKPRPTEAELAVADAILRTFGGPMLVEANVGRAKKFMECLLELGHVVAPKTHQQEPEQSGSK